MSLMLNIGASGAKAFQNKIDVTAQNIANASTTGYKRGVSSFKDLVYQQAKVVPVNGEMATFYQGQGVRNDFTGIDFGQGVLQIDKTDTSYAIAGKGYFGVINPATNQVELTRDGSFGWNTQGELVDSSGYLVVMNGEEPMLYLPTQTALMTELSSNRYAVAPENLVTNVESPEFFGTLQQGMLEASNVELSTEMTELIIAQRGYSLNLKSIQTADETLQIINQLR